MPYIFILLAGVLWGIIPVFVKNLTAFNFTSLEIVALRVWFSSVLLGLFFLFSSKKFLTIELKDLKFFVGTGIVSFVFFNYCYFNAIKMCSISAAALLLYTSPVFVMLISLPVLKEKINLLKTAALLLTMLGLSFITGIWSSAEPVSKAGLLFGLASGLGYAMYSIFGKFLVNKYHVLTITFYTFLVASLGIIPLIDLPALFGKLSCGNTLFSAFGIAFFCTILPFLAYTKGLSGVEAGKAAVLATAEPLVATILGYLLYGESLTLFKFIGMGLIFSAIVILNKKEKSVHGLAVQDE